MDKLDILKNKWEDFVKNLTEGPAGSGPVHKDISDDLFATLVTKYQEFYRLYHNTDHIIHMLGKVQAHYHFWHSNYWTEESLYMLELLYAATWYHDICYDPLNLDPRLSNEFFSAAAARRELSELGISNNFLKEVSELIMLTRKHKPNPDLDINIDIQHIFLDADMSILGEAPEKYLEYSEDVKKEYFYIGMLAAEVYYEERKKFLLKTLKNKPIFYTEYMQDLYEEQAYINMEDEIKRIDEIMRSI